MYLELKNSCALIINEENNRYNGMRVSRIIERIHWNIGTSISVSISISISTSISKRVSVVWCSCL